MCGIVGYVGGKPASEILINSLSRLEYRGYDSAGVAICDGRETRVMRAAGRIDGLRRQLAEEPLPGSLGIAHTRWATHGGPNERNAHPHRTGDITVVHNGIVENHRTLRTEIEAAGRAFHSETDTEVFAHLIDMGVRDGLSTLESMRSALRRVRGSYAVAVINNAEQDRLYVAVEASPLVIGLGDGSNLIASDVPALLPFTRRVIHLRDSEIAVLTRRRIEISTLDGDPVEREPVRVEWDLKSAEKDGHEHFMHKEIHEQPRVVRDTICDRITKDGRDVIFGDFDAGGELPGRVVAVACGTAYHAVLLAKYWIEELAGCPVEVDLASEFRYRGPLVDRNMLAVAVSQSGETADTLAALKLARSKGARTLAVCNVMDSSIPRHSDQVIYTRAGPEIGVASTKAFVSQLAVLFMLAVHLGRRTGKLSPARAGALLGDLRRVPDLLERALEDEPEVLGLSRSFRKIHNWLFLGRWLQFPIALEGALKLKEISYSHAEGYPAGEMKHGPIALVDEDTLVVSLCTRNRVYEKILSNMQEVRARKGRVLAVASMGDESVAAEADEVVRVPPVGELLEPLLTVLPLQLLSYHVANLRGLDVDRPRNLAKSVTVE